MIKSGANNLSNNKVRVDELNVFPVPDGDTGTNMSKTFQNAASNISYEASTAGDVAQDVASFTLRGARGNSGVILSQIFRGISSKAKGKKTIGIKDFISCIKEGSDSAYRAVMKPTEGTILTVIKSCAKKAAEYIKANFEIDEIYSSDLTRAYNTANETAKLFNLDIIKEKNFREINAGDWENKSHDYIWKNYEKTYRVWMECVGLAVSDNGESTKDVQERVFDTISKIVSSTTKENILIVSHFTPIKSFTAKVMNLSLEEMHANAPYPPNASLSKFTYKDGKFAVDFLAKYDYLEDLRTTYQRA